MAVQQHTPLRGFKTQLHEGGIRSATLVRWPGNTQPGTKSDVPVHAIDWMPTLTKLAGYRPDATEAAKLRWDGLDIAPLLRGETPTGDAAADKRTLYWLGVAGRESALRQGNWKLHVDRNGKASLYNLAADIGEANDLADAEPERVAAMKAALELAAARDYDAVTPETQKKLGNAKGQP